MDCSRSSHGRWGLGDGEMRTAPASSYTRTTGGRIMRHVVEGMAIATFAALVAAPSVHAQTMGSQPYPLSFGAAAGATIPSGKLSDAQSTGWHIEGMVDWTTPSTPLGLRA